MELTHFELPNKNYDYLLPAERVCPPACSHVSQAMRSSASQRA